MPPNTNMREMVLNHASLTAPDYDTALCWLKDLAIGMIQIRKIAQSSLRMRLSVHEIVILPNLSLFDAFRSLKRIGAREESVFLMRLSSKYPLLRDVESNVRARFFACEGRQLPPEDCEPLILCAIANWITVGFPSDSLWDSDQLTVRFNELLSDESIEEASETIDNLARSTHANSICERRHTSFFEQQTPSAAWEQRDEAFPNLVFGPDVKAPRQFLGSGIRRLIELDKSAAEWRVVGGPAPPWACKVTPESQSVRNNPALLNARRFRSRRGTRELYEWHARIGSGFRIHLRFDATTREVEIGYMGPHLPL
ncbi:MAG: hypothetical protein OXP71_00430 [Candidatus Poribacteria bacterium]|nr:hypothetical protein [Candidatus Poribacteria bacterium]